MCTRCERYDLAVEPEDFQAVGMYLRECLLSLVASLRRRTIVTESGNRPQDANFIAWADLVVEQLCRGASNKELRQYLKGTAKDTWQLVNWLTHDRDANKTASSIAVHGTDTVIGHFVQILQRDKTDGTDHCPLCKSRQVRTHFDLTIGSDGEYYTACAVCEWSSHPDKIRTQSPMLNDV